MDTTAYFTPFAVSRVYREKRKAKDERGHEDTVNHISISAMKLPSAEAIHLSNGITCTRDNGTKDGTIETYPNGAPNGLKKQR